MPLKKAVAYVLKKYAFRESDRIVVFFTRDIGKLRGVVRRAGNPKSRIGSSLETLNQVDVEYYDKPGRELVNVNTVELRKSASSKQSDLAVFYAFAYISELIDEFSQLGQPNQPVFRLITAVVELAEASNMENLLRYFEAWLLKLEGVLPDISRCGQCRKALSKGSVGYLPREGLLVCSRCGSRGKKVVRADTFALLKTFFSSPPAEIAGREIKREVMKNVESLLYTVIRGHLEKELKTYKAMKKLEP
jgi:DNA repair protein RecO (recombination protein O)